MPLFGAPSGDKRKKQPKQKEAPGWMNSCRATDEDGSVLSLTRLCLHSLADNIDTIWVKDYTDKCLDQYLFRYIMGPFNVLCAELVEDLVRLLCIRKKMSRAALDLLLVPQLRTLSLASCPSLATSAVCTQIAARCQLLSNLDFSGAQQLPSKVIAQTLPCLSKLRSLSLAGTVTDKTVIRAVVQNCPLLHHLDISRCHLLYPAALLLLGGSVFCSFYHQSSPSTSTSCINSASAVSALSPLPLKSLLALDIGFEDHEGDAVAVAAYLLLTLSGLKKLAIEGLAQACQLILHKKFDQTDTFAAKQRVPPLEEIWEHWKQSQESEKDCNALDPKNCSVQGRGHITLRLRDVRVLSCESLVSLGHLCPDICFLSINADYPNAVQETDVAHLTKALESFSGQLKSLSLQYSGLLDNLPSTVRGAGSALLLLTLEGVKTSSFSYVSLLEVIQACPRLTELSISAEHTQDQFLLEDINDDRPINWNLIHLPDLCRLTLRFSYEHSQMKPSIMTWMSLKAILGCLLARSPLLQKVSLISLPCPLNCVLREVLNSTNMRQFYSLPLRCLQHLDLQRTDVEMGTVDDLINQCKRLKHVNVSNCWNISRSEWMNCVSSGKVELVWM